MDAPALIDALEREGRLFADAAEALLDHPPRGLDARLPTCPDWTAHDLLLHLSEVHCWARLNVAGTDGTECPDAAVQALLADRPGNGSGLVGFYRRGHADLVSALRAAEPSRACWTFLDGPAGPAFWARRQSHETAIHRVDLQLTLGCQPDPAVPGFALDGIEELLVAMIGRPDGRLRADPPACFGFAASDAPEGAVAGWTVYADAESRRVTRGADSAADVRVTGPAWPLYLLVWNRGRAPELLVEGDETLLQLWCERARITWG